MKELSEKELYSLEGLSEEQLIELARKCDIKVDYLSGAKYIRFDGFWKFGMLYDNLIEPTARAIELFNKEYSDAQSK